VKARARVVGVGLNHEKKTFFDIKYDLLKNCIINE
jgi:hypothetical protein